MASSIRELVLGEIRASRLPVLRRLYSIDEGSLSLHPEYAGCRNIVFFYRSAGARLVLRVSFREDRDRDDIESEIDFIDYLASHGLSAARAAPSREGRRVEELDLGFRTVFCVSFVEARGARLPDKGYKYRDGVPIVEYYESYGRTLGRMHRLTRSYVPGGGIRPRPAWIDVAESRLRRFLPGGYDSLRGILEGRIEAARRVERSGSSYGLVHCDFGDGNFVIDYSTGEITTFDFDDSLYNWFMYEIADAWTKGVGWSMRERSVAARKDGMDRWFDAVMDGYSMENGVEDSLMRMLPFFIKLVEMDNFMEELRSAAENGEDAGTDAGLLYAKRCIEEDLPYLGFFDAIYSPDRPFELDDY